MDFKTSLSVIDFQEKYGDILSGKHRIFPMRDFQIFSGCSVSGQGKYKNNSSGIKKNTKVYDLYTKKHLEKLGKT